MGLFRKLHWFYVTRTIGAAAALYELFIDHGSERGTIILAAFGIMGFDWVTARVQHDDHK
jgi:hypothetical protein